MSTWRDVAAPIIATVIHEVGYSNLDLLRKALRDAYPFGERKYLPYKVWLKEINYQTKGRLSRSSPQSNAKTKKIQDLRISGKGDFEIAEIMNMNVISVRVHLAKPSCAELTLFK